MCFYIQNHTHIITLIKINPLDLWSLYAWCIRKWKRIIGVNTPMWQTQLLGNRLKRSELFIHLTYVGFCLFPFLLCLYTPVCEVMCVPMCTSVWRVEVSLRWFPQDTIYLSFWRRGLPSGPGTHWVGQAGKLSHFSTGISVCHHARLYVWFLQTEFRSSCLPTKNFTDWAIYQEWVMNKSL